MRNLVLALIVPFGLVGIAAPVAAQRADQPQPVAVQTQANPTGAGGYSFIPPEPASADSAVPAAMPADPAYHGGPYTGALTTPPPAAMNKTYPLCTGTMRDACVNPDQAVDPARPHHRATGPSQPN